MAILTNPQKLNDSDLKKVVQNLSKSDLQYLLTAVIDEYEIIRIGLKAFLVENFKIKIHDQLLEIEINENRKN